MSVSKLTQQAITNDMTSMHEPKGPSALAGKAGTGTVSEVLPVQYGGGTHPVDAETTADDDKSVQRTRGLLRGLKLVLRHHGAPSRVIESFESQATAYLNADEAVFFKRAKYLTVAPMAKYLKSDAPKDPFPEFRFTGDWKRWSSTRLRTFCRKNTHLWYSFLQGKRSALPLSDELVLTTYQEHRKAMEIKDPIDDETHNLVMKELEPVLNKISKTLQREYNSLRDEEFITQDEVRHVASTRACFEASRDKGGQLGYLSRLAGVTSLNPRNPTRDRVLPDLIRMVYYPVAEVGGRVQYNVLVEVYGYPTGETEWRSTIERESLKLSGRRLKATIQAVLEPLKVRVISKGEAVPYYIGKRLQKALHGIMRQMDCFRLIGRPICATDLFDLSNNRSEIGSGQQEWFSVDYSAATDNLSARLSSSIMDRLLVNQDDDMVELWKSILAPHDVRYPFPYSEEVAPVSQSNGQLMGSILSFPILCLANLGLYLAVLKEDPRKLKEKLRGVLVNGDDMLYVARRSMWEQHTAIGTRVGLQMSVGKAYHHPVYANANSTCFHFNLGSVSDTPYVIPFLNSGLYFGQNKVLGGDDIDAATNRCSVINRILEGCWSKEKQSEILCGYVKRHRADLDAEARGRNWFLPISSGGLGVNAPDGWKYEITVAQRQHAMDVLSRGYRHPNPTPSGAPRAAVQELTAPWLADLAEKDETELRAVRYQRGKRALAPRLDRLMRVPTFLCLTPNGLEKYGAPKRQKLTFEQRRQKDMISEMIEDLLENPPEPEDLSPWTCVGRSLDFALSMAEVEGEIVF